MSSVLARPTRADIEGAVEQAAAIRRAVELPFPADLLVRTPQQCAEKCLKVAEALRELVRRSMATSGGK